MSFSLQSGRYKPFNEDEFFIPKVWRIQSESNKQGSEGELDSDDLNGFFEQFYDNDEYHHYPAVNADSEGVSDYLDKYSKEGFSFYSALLQSNASKEQSRYFLPAWISPYEGIIKVDLLFFMRFLRLRLDNHAQLEIREYAQKMYDLWAEAMPITARYAKEYKFQGS